MKKSLLFSTVLVGMAYALPVDAAYCACAGRCATGASCNCSTGACTVPQRYAYGYVDTAAQVGYVQQPMPNYQLATPYRTSEPAPKYSPVRSAPYIAARLGIAAVEGDAQYSATVPSAPQQGGTWQKDFDDEVFFGSLAFGIKKNNWRAELEGSIHSEAEKSIAFMIGGSYTDNPIKAKLQMNTLLFNVFYDIPTNTRFTPFIGAGVGLSHIKGKYETVDSDLSTYTENHKKVNFAWQIGAGVSYALSGTVNLDLAYRYTHYGKAKLQSYSGCDPEAGGGTGSYISDHTDVKDLTSHSLSAGVRFSF